PPQVRKFSSCCGPDRILDSADIIERVPHCQAPCSWAEIRRLALKGSPVATELIERDAACPIPQGGFRGAGDSPPLHQLALALELRPEGFSPHRLQILPGIYTCPWLANEQPSSHEDERQALASHREPTLAFLTPLRGACSPRVR